MSRMEQLEQARRDLKDLEKLWGLEPMLPDTVLTLSNALAAVRGRISLLEAAMNAGVK